MVDNEVAVAPTAINGPTEFLYANEAETPLAVSKVPRSGDAEGYPNGLLLWRWGADGRFYGPDRLRGADPQGTDGRFVYVQVPVEAVTADDATGMEHAGSGRRFYVLDQGGAPQEIRRFGVQGAQFRFAISPALRGFGPVLLTSRPDPELPSRPLQERWVPHGTRLAPLEGYREARYRLDRGRLEVAADEHMLEIVDRPGGTRTTAVVPNRDDISGVESVALDRFGWLFVEKGGSDYALKLARSAGALKVERIVEYTGRGMLSRLLGFLFGMDRGAKIDEVHHSAQCADFSEALRLTFLCKPFRVLREGEPEKVDDAPTSTLRWKGDASGKRVALLSSAKDGLWATDGVRVQHLAALGRYAVAVQDVPQAGRTFITEGDQSWELVGGFPRLQLRRVNFAAADGRLAEAKCCLAQFRLSNIRFIAMPGTTQLLAFHSRIGVWELGNRSAKLLWRTGGSSIDLNSIARADVWKGMVFQTQARTTYRIGRCGASAG